MLRPAHQAWCAIGAFVVTYNLSAPDGETLSEGADDWIVSHRWLTRGLAAVLVGHVCNMWPTQLDAIHWLFVLMRRYRHLRGSAA